VRQLESCRHLSLFSVSADRQVRSLLPLCHPPSLWSRASGVAHSAGQAPCD
jgi:hypothetical protein